MGQLRRARPRATFHEHPHRDRDYEDEAALVGDGESESGTRTRTKMATKAKSRRTRLPPVHLSPPPPLAESFADEEEATCPVHYYRDNISIFSDAMGSHISPVFATQRRRMPWETRLDRRELSLVHAYGAQRSSLRRSTSVVAPGLEAWRTVGEEQRRQRPPREAQKVAMPGSTLHKKRASVLEARAAAYRARVGNDDAPPRVSILHGGTSVQSSLEGGTRSDLAPTSSASAPQLVYPRQSLPRLL